MNVVCKSLPKAILDSLPNPSTAEIVDTFVERDLEFSKMCPTFPQYVAEFIQRGGGMDVLELSTKTMQKLVKVDWIMCPKRKVQLAIATVYDPVTEKGVCLQLACLMHTHLLMFEKKEES